MSTKLYPTILVFLGSVFLFSCGKADFHSQGNGVQESSNPETGDQTPSQNMDAKLPPSQEGSNDTPTDVAQNAPSEAEQNLEAEEKATETSSQATQDSPPVIEVEFEASTKFKPIFESVDNEQVSEKDTLILEKCITNWQKQFPNNDEPILFKKYKLSLNIFGFGNSTIDDIEETADPQLTLIDTSLNIGSILTNSKTVLNLMNPNGFYCINTSVNVLNQTEINLHCNASLANPALNISVLSEGTPSAGVDVSVLSKTELFRKGECK